MSDIPEARRRLSDLTRELSKAQVRRANAIMGLMWRVPPERRASPTSRRITRALVAAVKAEFERDPDQSQAAVAASFKINPGRVSEIMRGEYDG